MIVLAILCSVVTLSLGDLNIKYAAVIFRHGDRTPVQPYPTDPWRNESLWPVKFGELTNIGKKQHYALGKWLRARYDGLLSKEFNPTEIYVKSTDVDRTLMSAQANLAGLYPPVGNSVWDSNLRWQPIPVHTVPELDDEILAMKKPCPMYNKEYKKLINSKEFQEKLSKYQSLMNYLAAYTGAKVKMYQNIMFIYNTLYIETLYNFTLPSWTNSVYPNKMRDPACYSFRIPTATHILKRLKVGPLLKQIIGNMKNVVSSDSGNGLKLSIYSAHDDTVASILDSLNIFDGNCPPYTSTVLMELVADEMNQTSIRISYRNSTEIVEPYVLPIPFCGELCPLDRFIELYKELIPANWEQECSIESNCWLEASYGAATLAILFFLMFRYLYHSYYRRETRIQTIYTEVNSASIKNIEMKT